MNKTLVESVCDEVPECKARGLRPNKKMRIIVQEAGIAIQRGIESGVTDPTKLERLARHHVGNRVDGSVLVWIGVQLLGAVIHWLVLRLLERWRQGEEMGS